MQLSKFGHNVLTTDGHVWARQRKIVASAINERVSKAVFNESVRQTQGMLQQIQSMSDGQGVTETNQCFTWVKKIAIHVLGGAGSTCYSQCPRSYPLTIRSG
jgi:cytochrome P450